MDEGVRNMIWLLCPNTVSEKGWLHGLLPGEGATRAPVVAQPATPEKVVKALKEADKWMK
jgi:hypothetical protein